jgi:hypothetical protein|tara:strand:+ start:110 stop:346 length:237 start_codon:yes stop_codon:yes gene_type:complete
MRKIIGIVIVSLLFSNIGFANFERLEEDKRHQNYMQKICIDGYLFIRTGHWSGTSSFQTTAFIQFYKNVNGKSLPTKC